MLYPAEHTPAPGNNFMKQPQHKIQYEYIDEYQIYVTIILSLSRKANKRKYIQGLAFQNSFQNNIFTSLWSKLCTNYNR